MNVVALHGETPWSGEPRETVIEELEELLEKARAGEIQGFCYAAEHRDRLTSYGYSGIVGGSHAMVGACYQLLHTISARTAE